MSTRTAALVFGIVFAVIGILGFMPAPPAPGAPALTMEHGHGMILGMFPTNTGHNVVHLLFALLGIAAWAGGWARTYFQVLAVSYGLLTVLGLIPATQTTFGLIPIWGNDVWLHAAVAVAAAYFGFVRGTVDLSHQRPAHTRV
jgi:hypothetical protein